MAVAAGHSENIEMQAEDDIYENVDTKTTAQEKDPQKILQPDIRLYRLVGVSVGLLCIVHVLLNIGLRLSLYFQLIQENRSLATDLGQIQSSFELLQSRYDNVTEERDDLKRILCESHGFTFGGGLCYYISSTEMKNWEESRQYCRDNQSDLMVIKSKEKQDFVRSLNRRVWLGLNDIEEEGIWKWVDGTTLTTQTYWLTAGGQPDNARNDEDCVVFVTTGDANGTWNDEMCSFINRWICERVH